MLRFVATLTEKCKRSARARRGKVYWTDEKILSEADIRSDLLGLSINRKRFPQYRHIEHLVKADLVLCRGNSIYITPLGKAKLKKLILERKKRERKYA